MNFNLCLNNHISNIFDRNAIPACCHFAEDKRRSNEHAKCALIKSITNTNKPKEAIWKVVKTQQNFWIRNLETLHGLNQELNPR